MATPNDPNDPNARLRETIARLDEHIVALTEPTMELAIARRKRTSELGLEEREPSDLIKKFVSVAGQPQSIGTAEPGQLNPDASSSDKSTMDAWKKYLGVGGAQAGPPTWTGAAGPLKGKSASEADALAHEGFTIPQFGDWQVDSLLKLAAHWAGKRAVGQYKSQAKEEVAAGNEPISPEAWAKQQGQFSSSAGWADVASKGASGVAAASLLHKKVLQPALDIAFGGARLGASLGYSPQAGGGINASHILGIPNPLAAFTSPAGRQGLGTFINSAEASFLGTGIGMGEATQLRESMAAQGWSNQRAGGALGMTVGGQQEQLALAMEPLVKMGFNSPTSIQQLGSWTNALKLGTGTPQELTKTLEQLPEAAKVLHKTLEEVTQGMEDFAAKAVEGGSTMIHGAQVYNGVWKGTGMNPLLTQTLNEGAFGKVAAVKSGFLPWQIASMSPNQTTENAMQAVRLLEQAAGSPGAGKPTKNVYGETEPGISAEAAKLAQEHLLEPNASVEYLKRMHELGSKVQPWYKGTEQQAITSGMGLATHIGQTISDQRHAAEATGPNVAAARKQEKEWHAAEANQKALEAKYKNPGYTEEQEIEAAKEAAAEKYHAMIASKKKAAGEGKLSPAQEAADKAELPTLYQRVREAGLGKHGEIKQWEKESVQNAVQNANAALGKAAEVNPEKEEKAKAEIVMNPDTEKWFKLQFPNAKAPNSAGAGGKSTASSAAQPNNESPSAMLARQMKEADQIRRHEPTAGG